MTTWYFTRIGANETFSQSADDVAGYAYEDNVTLPDGTTTDRFQAVAVADQQHHSGLYLARATDSFDPSAQTLGSTITFAATPLRPYFVGGWVRAEDAADSTTFIAGEISAYDPDTGSLDLVVRRTGGSGSVSDWLIKGLGEPGPLTLPGIAFPYTFDDTTSAGDPGAGNLRANNTDLTSATKLFIDDETAEGADVAAALNSMGVPGSTVKGQLQIVSRYNTATFALYDITGVTDQSGYVELDVTHTDGSGASPFANGADLVVGYTRIGQQGPTGASDFDWIVKSSAYTASKDDRILGDTSGGSFPVTLPNGPSIGDQVAFADPGKNWNTNNLTVDGNGNNIEGASTYTADVDGSSFICIYNGTQWRVRQKSVEDSNGSLSSSRERTFLLFTAGF